MNDDFAADFWTSRNETELQVLLAFKARIPVDPYGVFTSWNGSQHFCNWQGVTCGRRHRRVTALRISSLKLAGDLSPRIANLTFLRVINLNGNALGGEIQDELGSLSRIQILLLAANNFIGTIPTSLGNIFSPISFHGTESPRRKHSYGARATLNLEISSVVYKQALCFLTSLINGTNLNQLWLSKNNLTGVSPDSIGNLSTNLNQLLIGANYISGVIPKEIENLVGLEFLALYENMLTGSIPDSIGKLSKLKYLYAYRNNIIGEIPHSLGNLSQLIVLSLFDNLLGEIHAFLGNCSYLGNSFEGTIPSSFQILRSIQVLDVSHNNLSGLIPEFLGFEGKVPTKGVFNNISAFSVIGNSELCGGIRLLRLPDCPTKIAKEVKNFSLRVIIATDSFSSANLIGKGRYGSVYKGILSSDDQTAVAVKHVYGRVEPTYVKTAMPDHVAEIVDTRLNFEDEAAVNQNGQSSRGIDNIWKCLVSVLSIGVSCSADSQNEE
ncbi:LRR receptor-like serine/threonine-protein kinase EFR [Hibiscus syriacus]|uniref:LRR receptor-like serine/threonine-protein kinase EFR n=1 Tax=Hibiscus syriacus TaxID=106335 RepID=UPI0019214142|nr:LRR receptor-like serine/threonine-protein kinase EFR [Hibiscus syriacus]